MNEKPDVVLVADDDEDICRFVEVNLRLEGFEVVTAGDGEEALRAAFDTAPDLVLLDIMMPKMDGVQVCERLRGDSRTRNVSVIMLTAKSLSADKIVGLTAGADDYMIKPFDPMELVARVKSALRRTREMRDVNPLTQLPGNVQVQDEVSARVMSGMPFALLYIDLDHFKAFNDYYGFLRGDNAIKALASCITDAIKRHADAGFFMGHIGGDDFVAMVLPAQAEAVAQEIIDCWERVAPSLYDSADAARGYIEVADRRNQLHRVPITTVSIGIASTEQRPLRSHWEASEIATEVKQFAKRNAHSSYAIDRRRQPPDEEPPLP